MYVPMHCNYTYAIIIVYIFCYEQIGAGPLSFLFFIYSIEIELSQVLKDRVYTNTHTQFKHIFNFNYPVPSFTRAI